MKIKESNKQNQIISFLQYLKHYKVVGVLLSLFLYSFLIFLLGAVVHKTGFFGEVVKPAIKANIKIPFNYIQGLLSNPEHIIIDIKHNDFQKLAYKRKIALEEGVLHSSRDDFVPATIRWNGETLRVNMRLKGDLADHWSRDRKWSFRIRVRGNNTILGMKEFSIQHPRTRGFLNDWYLHQLLKHFGNFIVLRYEFVEVTLNGKYLGIYLLEEHFEKRLVEHNKYLDAPIIRIYDHLLWYNIDPNIGFNRAHLNEIYSSSPIDAFNTNTVNLNDRLLTNFNKAKNLLESFRRGKLATHQVFNIDKLAKLFAIIDLFGYRHSTAYSNIRFYYNPITSLLEPIGYDNTFISEANSIEGQSKKIENAYSKIPANDFDYTKHSNWHSTFFLDKDFFRAYIAMLEKISQKEFLDGFFEKTNQEYKKTLHILYKNFPGYSFDQQKSILYKNQEFINNILNPLQGLQAYLNHAENSVLTLELGNIQLLPLEVLDVSFNDYSFPKLQKELILQSKTPFQPVDFHKVQFKLSEGLQWSNSILPDIRLNYRIYGTGTVKNIPVFQWSHLNHDFLSTDFIRENPNYKEFDFIYVDEHTKEIFFKRGDWNLNSNLIIPEGYTVISKDGTRLNLTNSAKILSYSPLVFIGTETNPIIIGSEDSTGQGIVVLNTKNKSSFKNVIFKQLSPPAQSGWELSGTVTFYESPVDFHSCRFVQNKSGDGLHIIRSECTISQSLFKKVPSNALSVTFGWGKITDATFLDCGGDAMHFSGSAIECDNIFIKNVNNRGIDLADNSQVNIKNLEINNSKIAVESKDMSKVIINTMKVSDCEIGFSIFQSKPEYGSATISVTSLEQNNIEKPYLIEENSSLTIEGRKIKSNK